MSITNDNIQITSTIPSGATIGTDVVGSDQVHIQEVKINTGLGGVDTLMSNDHPVIVTPSGSNSFSDLWFPVAGSTDGTVPVDVNLVSGTLSLTNVTIVGGTLDRVLEGVSADIRSVVGGITIGVATVGTETVSVGGTVGLGTGDNNIGNVDVLTVAIPPGTGITQGSASGNFSSATLLPDLQFETGFRITNLGANTAWLGVTEAKATASLGYPLGVLDSLFIEATGCGNMWVFNTGAETSDLRIIGS